MSKLVVALKRAAAAGGATAWGSLPPGNPFVASGSPSLWASPFRGISTG